MNYNDELKICQDLSIKILTALKIEVSPYRVNWLKRMDLSYLQLVVKNPKKYEDDVLSVINRGNSEITGSLHLVDYRDE